MKPARLRKMEVFPVETRVIFYGSCFTGVLFLLVFIMLGGA